MKKALIGILSLFLVVGTASAQTGKKALKKASKEIGKYVANPAESMGSLTEGLSFLKTAFESEEVNSDPKAFLTKGQLYNSIIDGEWKADLLSGGTLGLKNNEAAIQGAQAYEQALSLAEKKGTKKEALKGLKVSEALLNNVGVKFLKSRIMGQPLTISIEL